MPSSRGMAEGGDGAAAYHVCFCRCCGSAPSRREASMSEPWGDPSTSPLSCEVRDLHATGSALSLQLMGTALASQTSSRVPHPARATARCAGLGRIMLERAGAGISSVSARQHTVRGSAPGSRPKAGMTSRGDAVRGDYGRGVGASGGKRRGGVWGGWSLRCAHVARLVVADRVGAS